MRRGRKISVGNKPLFRPFEGGKERKEGGVHEVGKITIK